MTGNAGGGDGETGKAIISAWGRALEYFAGDWRLVNLVSRVVLMPGIRRLELAGTNDEIVLLSILCHQNPASPPE